MRQPSSVVWLSREEEEDHVAPHNHDHSGQQQQPEVGVYTFLFHHHHRVGALHSCCHIITWRILHNSVCRLRKISTTLATTTTTRKRREKTSQSRTTLHKQVGFSFLFFFYYYYNHFLSYVSFFRETLYMARPTKLIGVAAKPPAKKTPRSVSCNARIYTNRQ